MPNVNLKAKRVIKGYSMKQMADIVGITNEAYRLKENGKREFKQSEIYSIMSTLNLSPEEVVEIFITLK